MNSINLRHAVKTDIPLLRHWDEQPHVKASDPNDYWGWEEDLNKAQPDWREQLIAEVSGQPIGFIQIIDPEKEETHYWGEVEPNLRAIDIWIGEADMLNKGYGTQMMALAIERCFSDPEVVAIIIDPLTSNTGAIRFYKRLGFSFIEYRTFGEDECSVFRLERNDWFSKMRVSPKASPWENTWLL